MDDDELSRRLRAAFDAKADSVGPQDLDVAREEELADLLAADERHGRARWATRGLAAAAAVAAAVGVGFLVDLTPQHAPPPVAATGHTSTSTAGPDLLPPESTSVATPTTTPDRSDHPVRPSQPAQPPAVTQSAPTPTFAPPVRTHGVQPAPDHPTTPVSPDSSAAPPAGADLMLTGDLRAAAGTDRLPLPADIPVTVQDRTSRTVILSTHDLAGVAAYWDQVMASAGWSKDSPLEWIAPTGNAWVYLSGASGYGTIHVSCGPG